MDDRGNRGVRRLEGSRMRILEGYRYVVVSEVQDIVETVGGFVLNFGSGFMGVFYRLDSSSWRYDGRLF